MTGDNLFPSDSTQTESLLDPAAEFKAMTEIASIIQGIPSTRRAHVLEYILRMFAPEGVGAAASGARPLAIEPSPGAQKSAQTFEDFPALLGVARAGTGLDRVLLAAYFVQVAQAQGDFDAFALNRELKHVGFPSTNITRDLDTLATKSPVLVMQVKKMGQTKQARKMYRLTHAGIQAVKEMLAN